MITKLSKKLNKDLKILKKLKVDFVYLPTVIKFIKKKITKLIKKITKNIMCKI